MKSAKSSSISGGLGLLVLGMVGLGSGIRGLIVPHGNLLWTLVSLAFGVFCLIASIMRFMELKNVKADIK